MQYGDLSNQRSPAIIINADLLVNYKKKWLGLRYELSFMLSTRQMLEHWFNKGDLSIYIVCMGELTKLEGEIEDILDTFMVPYTQILPITKASSLNYLVEAEHVIGYFYNSTTLVDERSKLGKHYQVPNLAEISYLLDGGARK